MQPTVEDAHAFIAGLDLTKIFNRVHLVDGMDLHSAKKAEPAYRQFLLIAWVREHQYQGIPPQGRPAVVPGPLADEMWHAHIIHTKEYHEMCEQLLGKYLHHSPDPSQKTSNDPANIDFTIRFDEIIPQHLRFINGPFLERQKSTSAMCCGGPCNSCGD